jgi:hypothetical protein
MAMKLLPAPANPVEPSSVADLSNGLVPAQRAIRVRADQVGVVPAGDAFTWSSRNRATGANRSDPSWSDPNWIDAIPVEESDSDEAARVAVEYVSGWDWGSSISVGRSVIAHYLSYAAGLVNGRGRWVDLYA